MKIIKCLERQQEEIKKMYIGGPNPPKLAIIQLGNNPASNTYVRQKIVQCAKANIETVTMKFNPGVNSTEGHIRYSLREIIRKANVDKDINAIILQLPLEGLSEESVNNLLDTIDPEKDVDCLCRYNIGSLHMGYPIFLPCTPAGVLEIFDNLGTMTGEDNNDKYDDFLTGKKVLIIGRSMLVGKPLSYLLTERDATVTLAHSKTTNLKETLWDYDIIISAVGKANLINENDFKRLSLMKDTSKKTLIDIGMNFDEQGLCGDICREVFTKEELQSNVEFITSTPGGTGRMTVLSLIRNVIKAKNIFK